MALPWEPKLHIVFLISGDMQRAQNKAKRLVISIIPRRYHALSFQQFHARNEQVNQGVNQRTRILYFAVAPIGGGDIS